eukprot:1154657-Pelagomonas_calceolata.AAC.6
MRLIPADGWIQPCAVDIFSAASQSLQAHFSRALKFLTLRLLWKPPCMLRWTALMLTWGTVGFTPGLIMHVSPNLLFSNLLSCRRTPMQGARKKIGSFRPQGLGLWLSSTQVLRAAHPEWTPLRLQRTRLLQVRSASGLLHPRQRVPLAAAAVAAAATLSPQRLASCVVVGGGAGAVAVAASGC